MAISIVQGIIDDYDKKKLGKMFKKKFSGNGTITEYPEFGKVLQAQGN